jgi:hypothetical protein
MKPKITTKKSLREFGFLGAAARVAAALAPRGGLLRTAGKLAMRNPIATGAALGSAGGAIRAATDGNPDTGIMGGALGGAAMGAGLGAGASALGKWGASRSLRLPAGGSPFQKPQPMLGGGGLRALPAGEKMPLLGGGSPFRTPPPRPMLGGGGGGGAAPWGAFAKSALKPIGAAASLGTAIGGIHGGLDDDPATTRTGGALRGAKIGLGAGLGLAGLGLAARGLRGFSRDNGAEGEGDERFEDAVKRLQRERGISQAKAARELRGKMPKAYAEFVARAEKEARRFERFSKPRPRGSTQP